MKLQTNTLLGFGLTLLIMSCQNQSNSSVKSNNDGAVDTTQVLDSAKAVAQKIFDYSNKLDFQSAIAYYSSDSDARFVENGTIYPSLAVLKDAYVQIGPTLDLLENTIKSWDMLLLNTNAVLFNLPVHAKIKAKGRPEYQFDYVWSAVIQKRNGKWMIVHCHESWVNAAEVVAAITPPPPSNK